MHSMKALEWNDYQLLLKIADSGTLSGAARALGTSQSTVSRRLKGLEDKVSAPLFFYKNGKYTPTSSAQSAITKARQMEAILQQAAPNESIPRGRPVRVTTVEFLSSYVLLPGLKGQKIPPLEISTSSIREDLRRKGYDIAIRMDKPAVSGLYRVKKLAEISYAVYARSDLAGRNDLKWISFGEEFSSLPDMKWVKKNISEGETHQVHVNSYISLAAAFENLEAQGVLPSLLGDQHPLLVRMSKAGPLFKRPVWLVVREDSLARGEVRDIKDHLIEIFSRLK